MYECLECSYCYVPSEGAIAGGISPGTPFSDLPDNFICPSCGASLDRFAPLIFEQTDPHQGEQNG